MLFTKKGLFLIKFSIDYLSFTIFNVEIQTIIDHLPKKDFTFLEKGRLGYKSAILYKGVRILYDGKKDMGIHVDASSTALGWAIDILLIPVVQGNTKYSRIDIACDCYDYDMYNLTSDAAAAHNYKSKRRKWSEIIQHNTATNDITGRTLYFGSRNSSVFLRIYDKALEQKIGLDWTRLELEIKGKSAHNLALIIGKLPLDEIFYKLINNYISFIDRSSDSNISRCKLLPFWDKFIKESESISVAPKKEEQTVSRTYNWLLKQVSRSIAKINKVDEDGNMKLINGLIDIGKKRLSLEDEEQITRFLKEI